MPSTYQSIIVNAPIEQIWQRIYNFHAICTHLLDYTCHKVFLSQDVEVYEHCQNNYVDTCILLQFFLYHLCVDIPHYYKTNMDQRFLPYLFLSIPQI